MRLSFIGKTAISASFIGIVSGAPLALHAKSQHREHAAHQHGAGKMGIAFDDINGKIDLKVPSESIFGFEHEAKNEAEKAEVKKGLDRLETRISEMIVFDPKLKCLITKDKIQVVPEEPEQNKKNHQSEHSETVASYNVICEKTPSGTKMTFNIQKVFPKIKDMDVDVLIGSNQKSVEAKKNGTTLELE